MKHKTVKMWVHFG